MATTGSVVALVMMYGVGYWPRFILIPAVALSRIVLRRPDWLQVTAGASLGLLLVSGRQLTMTPGAAFDPGDLDNEAAFAQSP